MTLVQVALTNKTGNNCVIFKVDLNDNSIEDNMDVSLIGTPYDDVKNCWDIWTEDEVRKESINDLVEEIIPYINQGTFKDFDYKKRAWNVKEIVN